LTTPSAWGEEKSAKSWIVREKKKKIREKEGPKGARGEHVLEKFQAYYPVARMGVSVQKKKKKKKPNWGKRMEKRR